MQLTWRVRAYPTARQHRLLADYLDHTRQLYNACLQERLDCYRKTGRTINKYEQSRELTELRQDEAYARFPRRLQRWAVNLVDAAYLGMFTRHKKGEKLGVPRFRGRMFWSTIGWDAPIDFTMRERGLYNRKSFGGTLRLRPDRELPPFESCKMVTMARDGDRWFAHLTYEVPDVVPKREQPKRPVGIDIGLITLAARSDGALINVPREAKEDVAQRRRLARALSRCKRHSRRRRRVRADLRRHNAKVARRRKEALHVVSARLTHHFDAVAVEKLNIAGLNQGGGGGAAGRGIRKSWRDRAPGQLLDMLEWKAKRDGRRYAEVVARNTSIDCNRCGAAVIKTLAVRVHRCECGEVVDRDVNAARNVLARAGWGPGVVESDGRKLVFSGADLALKHGTAGRTTAERRGARSPPSTFLRGRNAPG